MNFVLNNICFAYKAKSSSPQSVFSGLNLSIRSSESVLIVGEEGSGKTTLLQLLNGLQKPDAGIVLVDGKDIWQRPHDLPMLRRKIGFAFQFPEQHFFCETVSDELQFGSRNFGLADDDAAIESAVRTVGLPPEVLALSPFALSMGEARRVAIATLLVAPPDAFLLDEPTAGLDSSGIAMVHSLVGSLKERGKTVILVSHYTEVFLPLVDSVVLLENGTARSESDPFNSSTKRFN